LSQITDEFIKLKQELEQKTQDIAELREIAYEDKQTNLSREKTDEEVMEDDFCMISPSYDEDDDVILPRASYKVLYQREVEKKQEMKETLSELVEKIAKLETKIVKLESQQKQQTEKMEEQQMQKTVVEQPKPLAPSR
jgi:predicted transcriptional regulator